MLPPADVRQFRRTSKLTYERVVAVADAPSGRYRTLARVTA